MRVVTAGLFSSMVRNGARCLYGQRKTVNELNVFPVPDGDTGDNMFLTIDSGAKAISQSEENSTVSEVSAKVSHGMLMGARGNSGVILSRIFAGMAKALQGLAEADIDQVKRAFLAGVDEAYSAVSRPVEGTMLTVVRESVREASEKADDIEAFFETLETASQKSLERTPDKLAVLRENGVVDSGGAGLVYIFEGFNLALNGKMLSGVEDVQSQNASEPDLSGFGPDSVLEYGYCTEFLLRLQSSKVDLETFDENRLFGYLHDNGESVVAFRDGSIIKVHVHTMHPGEILNHCQKYGEFLKLKIENMALQHSETKIHNAYKAPKRKVHKVIATVAVASGEGLEKLFMELGTDCVVPGGQSMNPSVDDFFRAFESLDAEHVVVLPNNKNIILTAKQACTEYSGTHKDMAFHVIGTRTVGEGYAAVSNMDTEGLEVSRTIQIMEEAAAQTVTGFVAKASRTTSIDGVSVVEGHYIGFTEDSVLCDFPESAKALENLALSLCTDDFGILLLVVGKEADASKTDSLVKSLQSALKDVEIIAVDGGQPVHDYILVFQ